MIDNDYQRLPEGSEYALVSLEKKLQLLRDLVTAVVKSFKNGLFLYGGGGMGKSYNVLLHLTDPCAAKDLLTLVRRRMRYETGRNSR